MKIVDVLNLLEPNKLVIVITPNEHEAKLLYDRFILSKLATQIDKNSLNVNGSELLITHSHSDECLPASYSRVIVEFPEACPRQLFKKLPVENVVFSGEIV